MSTDDRSALERAFELARSGKCRNVTEIKQALAAERYQLKDFVGKALPRQLREVIRQTAEDRRLSELT